LNKHWAVVIEKTEDGYSAYAPDLPGCVAAGDTVETVEREMVEAIRFHVEGLKLEGMPVPDAVARVEYVAA
jgi:predicted RNase H-like HicB family nuclease